jgi:hypothetical protein
MKRRRRNASDVLAPVVELEGLLVFGGIGLLAYWILSGEAQQFFCGPGGNSGICAFWPKQTQAGKTLALPGQAFAPFQSQANSTTPHTIAIATDDGGSTAYGSSYAIPGTGQSIGDLQALGYTDAQIGTLINSAPIDDGNPDGGASGSW